LDGDAKFGHEVADVLTQCGMKPVRTSPARPWQNGVAERWIGSCRRDLLDHVLIFNEAHLRRLVKDYVAYYHTDRTMVLRRTHQRRGRLRPNRPSQHNWYHSHGPAGCIIDTIGSRLREELVRSRLDRATRKDRYVSLNLEARRDSFPSCRVGPLSPPESSCFPASRAGIQFRFSFDD
jgi:hypothetical protein